MPTNAPNSVPATVPTAAAPTNNLTPKLTQGQLKQNIDALQKGGMKTADVQSYVNNYKSDGQGGFVLANQPAAPAGAPAAPAAPPLAPAGSPEADVAGDAQGLKTATEGHAANIVQDLSQKPSFSGAADVLGQVGGEGGDIIGSLLKLGAQATVPQPIRDLISKAGQALEAAHQSQAASGQQPTNSVGALIDKFQAQNPDLYKSIAGIGSAAGLAAGTPDVDLGEGGSAIASAVKTGAGTAADMVGDAAKGVVSAPGNAISAVTSPSAASDLDTITDNIAPKMNTSEMKQAVDEGRVVRAKQGTISQKLFGQAPDVVTQSDEVKQAAATIQKNIPGAAKMNDTELYSALDKGVATKAQTLRPVMESTPVDVKTISKAQNAWSALKTQQVTEVGAGFDNMPGATAMQSKFQNVIDSLTGNKAGDMGDVWDARIAYDKSVPANVKSATSISSDALQYKKAMWLQNRSILNDVINDTTAGLGATSKQAFSEMSDMYTAQENILSKAPKPTEAGAGAIGKGGKFSLGKTAGTVAKVAGGAWIGGTLLNKIWL